MDLSSPPNDSPPSPRGWKLLRRLRFSMRTILIGISVLAALLAYEGNRYRAQTRCQLLLRSINPKRDVFSYKPRAEFLVDRDYKWILDKLPKWFRYDVGAISFNENDDINSSAEVDKAFAASAVVGTVQEARFDTIRWTPERLQWLGHCEELRSIVLIGKTCDDRIVEQLLQIPELQGLVISGTRLSDTGIQRISELRKLRWLLIEKGSFRRTAIERMRADLPNTYVTVLHD